MMRRRRTNYDNSNMNFYKFLFKINSNKTRYYANILYNLKTTKLICINNLNYFKYRQIVMTFLD